MCVLFQTTGRCSMYGECQEGPTGNLNCVYDGPPKPMNESEGLEILRTYCPNIVTSEYYTNIVTGDYYTNIVTGKYYINIVTCKHYTYIVTYK